ncbi:MAG: serine/threonine protein kinase, partial [Pirellulaceae bacterium]
LITHLVVVCKTVAYAHNRGIIHRDIKPDNIMIGRFGETLLVDWGLASAVQRDERARASGENTIQLRSGSDSGKSSGKSSGSGVGTIGYMSPEQLPDHPGPLTTASDIYSLGATLYRILTNRAPIQGRDESLLVDKIRWGDFPRPRAVQRDVSPALEAICLRAMATDPAERYATALDMAADLEAWQADESVSVYRAPFSERLVRWGRVHQHWVIVGTMTALLVLLGTVGMAAYQRSIASAEASGRRAADAAREEAEEAQAQAERAQRDGMRLAARFAARTVANEIDLRWRILTKEAAAPELRQLMAALADQPAGSAAQRDLQTWLESRRMVHQLDDESWFLTDVRGVQVARDPFSRTSINQNFAYRTYFHGGPRALEPGASTEPIQPIQQPHLSSVYHSVSTGTLKVAFSVPIWKNDEQSGESLGVLAITVEIGAFRELQTGLNAGQIAVLIDTRDDQIEGEPRRGLILHHPDLAAAIQRRLVAGDESFYRVSASQVDQLLRLRKLRSREAGMVAQLTQAAGYGASRVELAGSLVTDYHDPLAPADSPAVTAAFEPVRIETRPIDIRDTGWVVSVQEAPRSKE